MSPAPRPTRRQLLRWLGIAGATGALSSCASTGAPRPARSAQPAGPAALAALSSRLSSPLLRPGEPGYAPRAELYNPRFAGRPTPLAIAACRLPADVTACVRYAAASGTALHLRAGGHSYGGWSSGPGLLVDTSGLDQVVVDHGAGTVRVGAGVRLAAVYAQLGRAQLALAAGSCPTVGLTGLTLGGGVGVLSRVFGLTCDALRSVQLVTADGALREVDARTEPDLFWALRGGGGGSFGAVTALTLAVRPAPTVHTFYLAWDSAHATSVITAWQQWIGGADHRLWSTCKLLVDPARGRAQAQVSGTWVGPAAALTGQLAPLLVAVGPPPRSQHNDTLSYPAAMLAEAGCSGQDTGTCLAQAWGPARRLASTAASAVLLAPLPAAGVQAAVAATLAGLQLPQMVEGGISLDALGGAVAEVGVHDTAFVHRRALATAQYTATWRDGAADTGPFDRFVQRLRADLLAWTGPAAYVNYADPALPDYGAAYWGANYPRLQAVKRRYDPAALFTFAQAVSG